MLSLPLLYFRNTLFRNAINIVSHYHIKKLIAIYGAAAVCQALGRAWEYHGKHDRPKIPLVKNKVRVFSFVVNIIFYLL